MTDSTEKPPTMRALTEQVAVGVAALVSDVERRNSAKAETAAPKPYTEADALARCIAALQDLKNVEDSRSRGAYSSNTFAGFDSDGYATWGAGDRILRFLAARFAVRLIEIRQPDCARPHVDTISPDAFISALRSSSAVAS